MFSIPQCTMVYENYIVKGMMHFLLALKKVASIQSRSSIAKGQYRVIEHKE